MDAKKIEAANRKVAALLPGPRRVIDAIDEGYYHTNEIADRLFLSPETIKRHLGDIYDLTGVSGILELVIVRYRKQLAEEADHGPVFVRALESILTPRQLEVAILIGKGWNDGDISRHLGISKYTTERHIKDIYERLGFSNRIELALRVIREEFYRSNTLLPAP